MGFVQYKKELLRVMLAIKKEKFLEDFLHDLLTPAEWSDVVTRWQIAKRLKAGVQQRTIAKNLKVSIAKVTRGSRVLLNKKGAFNKLLQKTKTK